MIVVIVSHTENNELSELHYQSYLPLNVSVAVYWRVWTH